MRSFLLGYGLFASALIIGSCLLYLFIMLISRRTVLASIQSAAYSRFRELGHSAYTPPVSVLVPAYNEELTVLESVRSLLSLDYPGYEVIVVNDGSKDGTLQVLIEAFGLQPCSVSGYRRTLRSRTIRQAYRSPLHPRLVVIDKDNGGKADALNAGINVSRYPLIATVDADSMLEKDALLRLVRTHMENPEEHIAVGGNVRIANGSTIEHGMVRKSRMPRRWLPAIQSVEYAKSFLGGRIGWSAINGLTIISGAFGLFRKDRLIEVGGYEPGCPGEDMNVVLKLHKRMLDLGLPYSIVFCPDAVCWTQAPDTLQVLASQRRRWMRGSLWNLAAFRSMLFIPKYKTIGFLSLPYTIIYETLGPYLRLTGFLALVGYCLLDMTNWPILAIFIAVNALVGLVFTCGALLIDEMAFRRSPAGKDLAKTIVCSLLMAVGYDQLQALWKLAGQWEYVRKSDAWGNMVRTSWQEGADSSTASSAAVSAKAGKQSQAAKASAV